ncbi:MAG: nitrilase-related carbon-nitrogen hydrolase [Candidatus Aminicenantes bacterium]|jgi:predicted amidohydrolase
MKVAIAQIAPHLGDVNKNFDVHLDLVERAQKNRADLIVFPELSLTGYTLQDFVPEVAIKPSESPLFQRLKGLSENISLVVGFVEEKERGLFFNSAAFLSGGEIRHIHRKIFLPTYGMFEELKFFGQGKNFLTFDSPLGKTGLMICYDFLHYGAGYLLFAGGSEIVIVLSAAPGRGISGEEGYETSHMWELMGESLSRFSTAFVIYANRVGFEDGKSFAGGSFIYNPGGRLVAKAAYGDEEFMVTDIDLDEIRAFRKKWPYKRDEKPEIILEALKRIVAKYED